MTDTARNGEKVIDLSGDNEGPKGEWNNIIKALIAKHDDVLQEPNSPPSAKKHVRDMIADQVWTHFENEGYVYVHYVRGWNGGYTQKDVSDKDYVDRKVRAFISKQLSKKKRGRKKDATCPLETASTACKVPQEVIECPIVKENLKHMEDLTERDGIEIPEDATAQPPSLERDYGTVATPMTISGMSTSTITTGGFMSFTGSIGSKSFTLFSDIKLNLENENRDEGYGTEYSC